MICARVPGRVEILGNHTDTQGGWVLAAAIAPGVDASFVPRSSGSLEVLARRCRDEVAQLEPAAPAPDPARPWSAYVAGMMAELVARGIEVPPGRLELGGDLPMRVGLGSSAATCVAVGLVLARGAGVELPLPEMAAAAQAAEARFAGVACGILDPLVALSAQAGHALVVDARAATVTTVRWPEELLLVLTRTSSDRALAASEYNERRRATEAAAQALGVRTLREVDAKQLAAAAARLDPVLLRRARHIVDENARVLAAAEALARGDGAALGAAMLASHESSRVDFENSTVELDFMVEAARLAPGCLGARLTGAGWGGATVALVEARWWERTRDAVTAMTRRHMGIAPSFLVTRPAGGAQCWTSGTGLPP